MAKKNVFVHLDMNKQELQNVKAQNVTTAEKTTLAGTLVAADKGFFVYDTDLLTLFVWNGTTFENVTPAPPQVGQHRGGVSHTDAEPASLVSGDWVVFTSAGLVTNFGGTETVQIGDWAIYNGTTWNILQGNVDVATQSTVGLVRLATYTESITGQGDDSVMTPNKANLLIASKFTQQFNVNLIPNVPYEITGRSIEPFDVKFYDSSIVGRFTPIELDWYFDLVNNKIVIESNITLTSIAIFVFDRTFI